MSILERQEDKSNARSGMSGKIIDVADNFRYRGGWIQSISKGFEIRKAHAWSASHMLDNHSKI